MNARLLTVLLLTSCVPPQGYQGQGQSLTAQTSHEDEVIVACATLCAKVMECQGSKDTSQLEPCVMQCAERNPAPAQLQQLAAQPCGQLAQQQQQSAGERTTSSPSAGQASELAGVWVGEESSLDPSFYMRYTQYITLYPDGSVGWAKSEGAASRTRIDENWVRFRSWRSGETPPDVYGTWQSDGAQISIKWHRRQTPSTGPVQGNKMRLSNMGVLEEGAALVFEKQ